MKVDPKLLATPPQVRLGDVPDGGFCVAKNREVFYVPRWCAAVEILLSEYSRGRRTRAVLNVAADIVQLIAADEMVTVVAARLCPEGQ
jgi:hypothetical protein